MIFSCTHKLYMINLSLSSVFSYFITVFYFMARFLCLKAEKCRLYHGLMEGLFCYVAQIHHYFWRLFSVGATIGRQQIVEKKITGDQWSPLQTTVDIQKISVWTPIPKKLAISNDLCYTIINCKKTESEKNNTQGFISVLKISDLGYQEEKIYEFLWRSI